MWGIMSGELRVGNLSGVLSRNYQSEIMRGKNKVHLSVSAIQDMREVKDNSRTWEFLVDNVRARSARTLSRETTR